MSERNKIAYRKFERLLNDNNVKTADVSRETGISKSTFSAWKKDAYDIKLGTLQKIADYFGVSVVYFIE